ncbi:MAG: hypothetical protein NUV77_20240 [Thermoguttaceae bacterium]|jgi:hypothetical protein|nr:hypothetical protein [Thermoguttaceae bacterium]
MSKPIQVRGLQSRVWPNVLRAVGILVLIGAAWVLVMTKAKAAGVLLGAAGAVLLAVNEIVTRVKYFRRRWVIDNGSGFTVIDMLGEQPYRDNQVTDLLLEIKDVYSAGVLKALVRRLVVWIEGRPDPVEMVNRLPAGTDDPLLGLIQRLWKDLGDRCRDRLERGGALEGDGWTLTRQALSVHDKAGPREVRIGELAEVGVFSGNLCVWKRDVDQPIIKISPSGRNVPILQSLLADWLKQQAQTVQAAPTPRAVPPSANGRELRPSALGRVLFERRKHTPRVLLIVLAVLGLILGTILLARRDLRGVGVVAVGLAVAAGVGVFFAPASVFQCREQGVRQSGLFGAKEVRFDQTQSFTYHAVRMFINGVYSGTSFTLRFQSPAASITYVAQLKNVDDDLEQLRDHVSRVIAARMAGELAQGKPVAWTPNLMFLPEGLSYRPSGFFGRKEPQVLPYNRVRSFDFEKGTFRLWSVDSASPVVQESASAANFFPGFFLLVSMFEPSEGSGEPT